MARRAIVGLIWCLALYFGIGLIVSIVAGNLAASRAAADEDRVAVGEEAGARAWDNSRYLVAFGVVGVVFLSSRAGYLPGAGRPRSPLLRR